jgi:flavin-binding protein dodecin
MLGVGGHSTPKRGQQKRDIGVAGAFGSWTRPRRRRTCVFQEGGLMSNVVKVIEVLSESEKGWEDAAQEAVRRASKTLKEIRSIYIEHFEAKVEGDRIVRYRINGKISFLLE